MGRDRARTLAERGRDRLVELGGAAVAGKFVCPLCLRLLPDARASAGHYPAEAVPGPHSTELLCADCNSYVGSAYENEAVDFLNQVHRVTMGPADTGKLSGRAKVRSGPEGIGISLIGSPRRSSSPGSLERTLGDLRARSRTPHKLDVTLRLPSEEQVRRALLAWSYLAWFYYAGYRYAASAGAELVRRLLLEPDVPLPTGAFFSHGSVALPLPIPKPILVIRAERATSLDDLEEVIAIGVEWGAAVSVLPFANDEEGHGWRRIEQLLEFDSLRTVRRWPMREMLSIPLIEKGLRADMVIEKDGDRHVIAGGLPADDLAALAEGRSARIIDPQRSVRPVRVLPPSAEASFTAVESSEFGGPGVAWGWRGCRLHVFELDRLMSALSRGRLPRD